MIIHLTQGFVTHVDRADYDVLAFFTWCVAKCGRKRYAQTWMFGRRVYMHRFLMGEPDGIEIDHRDEDGLNNRRRNMRVAAHHQNLTNRGLQTNNVSGFKGVGLHRPSGLWGAKVKAKGVTHSVGYHVTPKIAAQYYNLKARDLHGEFAAFNNVTPRFPRKPRAMRHGGRPPAL